MCANRQRARMLAVTHEHVVAAMELITDYLDGALCAEDEARFEAH